MGVTMNSSSGVIVRLKDRSEPRSQGSRAKRPKLEICTLQMGMYISSQSSCDFTTVTIIGESEDERTIEEIIQNYYDREDGETTPRFEV
ncbi:hypothetical protein Tco_0328631 [Tanacetum coccineum]